jgi:hypothetical protein
LKLYRTDDAVIRKSSLVGSDGRSTTIKCPAPDHSTEQ